MASEAAGPVVVLAPDSFKGTLSSAEVSRACARALALVAPGARTRVVAVADGGEGTLDALRASCGATLVPARVTGPLGEPVRASWALLPGGRDAVVEMAQASGLTLVPAGARDPVAATSRGTGELIAAALDAGARTVTVGIGGSATNDGGMGALAALGARFLDGAGRELAGTGADLASVRSVDLAGLDARLRGVRVRAMCDVDNPLLGPRGATAVFGPQKGAGPEALALLERGMANYARVLSRALGHDVARRPGAGAAGGMGCALASVLGAELASGIGCVLDLADFDGLLAGAWACVTGEGNLDAQTSGGKAVAGVAARCRRAGVPCLAVAGGCDATPDELRRLGVAAVETCDGGGMGRERALARPRACLDLAAGRLFARLVAGEFGAPPESAG